MINLHKKICIGVLLVTFSLPVLAQIGEFRRNFSVGVNGGMNFNSVSFNPNVQQGTLTGITGGLTARYISEKYFAMLCGIQVELNYSQHGWTEVQDEIKDIYTRTMNYIEVPLLAHLAFGKDQGVQFFLNLGPQVGFLLSESEEKGKNWEYRNTDSDIIDRFEKKAENKFDYGIVGGGGLELRTKAGNFLIEGRYYFALSDFYGNSKKDPFSRSAHSAIQAKITYLFDLSK